MLNKTARFAKINLGKIGSDTADTIIRLALGNVDVRYNGELYVANGDLVGIGDTIETLLLSKTDITLTLSSVNLTLLAQVDSYRYQNSPMEVWIGKRESDGSISNVHQVFKGVCDRHKTNNSSISLVGESVWSTFEQPVGARTTSSEQASYIARGLYGVGTSTEDTGFDYADESFTGLTLGKVPSSRVSTTEVSRRVDNPAAPTNNRPTFEQIPGRPGTSLSDPGDAYRRPVVYGEGKIIGKLIYAVNPTVSAVETAYGTDWSAISSGVTDSTTYATFVDAVAEGEVSEIDVVFKDAAITDVTLSFTSESKKYVLDSAGKKLAAVEVKFGKDDQTAIQSVIDIDGSNKWTSTSRCLGTVIVSVTCIASELWSDGFPSYFFKVKGKKVKTVNSSGVLSSTASQDVTYNPAWAILDLLLSPLYGGGLTADQIDFQSFYDGSIIYSTRQYNGSSHPTITRGVLTNGQSLKASLDSLLAASRSNLPFANGKVRLNVNHYLNTAELASVESNHIDENDVLGKIGEFDYSGSNKVLNTVIINTPVLGRSISSTYPHTLQDPDLLLRDKGIVSKKTIFANFNSTELLADGHLTPASLESSREYARSVLRSSNFFVKGDVVVDYWSHSDVRAGTVISLSSNRRNLVKAKFKVGSVTFMSQGMLKLSLLEFNQVIYDTNDSNINDYRRVIVPSESFPKPSNFSASGTDGAPGTNGVPAISYTGSYNNFQTSGGFLENGTGARWKIRNDTVNDPSTASTTDDWTTSTTRLFLSTDGIKDNASYFDTLVLGDYCRFTAASGSAGTATIPDFCAVNNVETTSYVCDAPPGSIVFKLTANPTRVSYNSSSADEDGGVYRFEIETLRADSVSLDDSLSIVVNFGFNRAKEGEKGADSTVPGPRGSSRFSSIVTLSGTTIPSVASTTFNTDALAAIVVQLGSGATPVKGDTISITYATSAGVISSVNGSYSGSAWAAFALVLDGGLLVKGTVATDKLAANAITTDKLASNSVTSDNIVSGTIVSGDIQTGTLTGDRFVSNTVTSTQIDTSTLNVQDMNLTGRLDVDSNQGSLAWGKTSGADISTSGLYLGNSGGNPFFNIGDSGSYIQYSNGQLYVVGALFSGSSAEGATEDYVNPDISYTYNIPPTASEIKIDLTGGGGGGAGQATGNGVSAFENNAGRIHTTQFGTPNPTFFGPSQAIAGGNGGDTVVKLFSSSDTLLATYTGNGGSGGAATGPNAGTGFVTLLQSFTTVTSTDPQGEAGNSTVFGAGTGGLSWDFTGNIYATCGGSTDNYVTCSPTRNASVGTGVGSGGGAGGYQVTDLVTGHSLKGFNLGGKRGSNGSATVNLAAAGAGSGSYLIITVGAGGAGKGTFEATASGMTNDSTPEVTRYQAVSRQGAGGSNGGARITVTAG